jgi:hypothetical protein
MVSTELRQGARRRPSGAVIAVVLAFVVMVLAAEIVALRAHTGSIQPATDGTARSAVSIPHHNAARTPTLEEMLSKKHASLRF